MAALLHGKGLWEYVHPGENFDQLVGRALELAPQMGVTHILFKVGNGPFYYASHAVKAEQRIRQAGLTPLAWVWLQLTDVDQEADIVAKAFALGYKGLIFNMEDDCRGRYQQATQLGARLQALGIDPELLYVCSYPNIATHRGGPPYSNPNGLPYDQMAAFCRGGMMPMAYGTFLKPPEMVLAEWSYGHHKSWCQARNDSLPLYPTLGPFYDDQGQNRMSPQEFAPWLETLASFGPSFFSIYSARDFNPALAAQVKAFVLGGARTIQVISPTAGFVRLRSAPTTYSDEIAKIADGASLKSLEDGPVTDVKVGYPGQWLKVRSAEGQEGFVAAWYLQWAEEKPQPKQDTRQLVNDQNLPVGQSAWLYGIHILSVNDEHTDRQQIRDLYLGAPSRGWILFSECVDHIPDHLQPDEGRRARFWDWARNAGFGVIIRINHAYGPPNGTVPVPERQDGFAQACARYAELYLKHPEEPAYQWTILIGNEQNNPREWPSNGGVLQPITPAWYAQAFNKAYPAVKSVMGDHAIVCPGAIDPYNYDKDMLKMRPLDYFSAMLAAIPALDGFALHAYTHGHDLKLITVPSKFGNDPLTDHYYDFQCYRGFLERIPEKWRDLPVYITETNPLYRGSEADPGWHDANLGWVKAAYAEINRWNGGEHAQQVRALILYMWTGDQWELKGKHNLLQDFREALPRDERWRA